MRLECGLLSHCYDQLTKVKCHAHVENKKKDLPFNKASLGNHV